MAHKSVGPAVSIEDRQLEQVQFLVRLRRVFKEDSRGSVVQAPFQPCWSRQLSTARQKEERPLLRLLRNERQVWEPTAEAGAHAPDAVLTAPCPKTRRYQ